MLANPGDAVRNGPQLRRDDYPLAGDLLGGFLGLDGSRARFMDVEDGHVLRAADFSARYKMRPNDAITGDSKEARRYFLEDPRNVEHSGCPQAAFIIDPHDRLPSNLQIDTAYFKG